MEEWYLGWEKVSCLEKCPQFGSVLIERETVCIFSEKVTNDQNVYRSTTSTKVQPT